MSKTQSRVILNGNSSKNPLLMFPIRLIVLHLADINLIGKMKMMIQMIIITKQVWTSFSRLSQQSKKLMISTD